MVDVCERRSPTRIVTTVQAAAPAVNDSAKTRAFVASANRRSCRPCGDRARPDCFSLARVVIAAFSAAGARARPPLSYDDARHLLNRTGFGATDAEIRRFVGMTREDAARTLLAQTRTQRRHAAAGVDRRAPARCAIPARRERHRSRSARQFQQEQVRDGLELRGWWLDEMLATPSPLTERMTLFWHNHFVSEPAEGAHRRAHVPAERHAARQRARQLRRCCCTPIARDPAMVIYLDNAQNRKGTPNENFAREVMELFTLGEGHYSEQDIKEAARAFTGWSLDRDTGAVRVPPLHSRLRQQDRARARAAISTATTCSTSCSRRAETAEFVTAQAVARVRLARSRRRRGQAHRRTLPRFALRHQGRVARRCSLRTRSTPPRIAAC